MADKAEYLQAIDDAILDADSLEQFINGSDSETVLTRLSAEYPTLQKALKELFENGGIADRFETLADLQISDLAEGSYALVADDTANNGLYVKTAGTWVKSGYDPLEQAKADATIKTNTAKNEAIATSISYTNKNTMQSFVSDVDSNTILVFTDKRGAPTWLQVASDGGLTDTAKRYISAALQNSGTDIASDDYFLVVTDKADRIVAYIDADGLINGGKATAEVQGADLTTWAFFGSSSMYYLADDVFSLLSSTFPTIKNSKIYGVSASKLGHTLANIGVNNGFVSFTDGVIDNTERATVKSGFYTNDLGVHAVSGFLENGVAGELKKDSFKATDAVSIQADADLPIRFTSNGSTHSNAVALVNLGKNNVEWSDGAKTVIEGTRLAVDYLDNANDGHTIVLGHFVNNDQGSTGKDNVIKINRQLKTLYRGRFIDVQAYLMSEQVWADIGITKTAEDIAAIANGVLPPSLGRNASHLSEAVDIQLAKQIVNLVNLKGWYL